MLPKSAKRFLDDIMLELIWVQPLRHENGEGPRTALR